MPAAALAKLYERRAPTAKHPTPAPRMPNPIGTLSIVATPIGNLDDITMRALAVLRQADLILAEDTRRAAILLSRWEIATPVKSFHQHNEAARLPAMLARLADGAHLALTSDAGTPLINDPGHRLVVAARRHGLRVTPVPGACALIAALSAAGHAVDRFCFEGFLPAKAAARAQRLATLKHQPRTLVLYESSHRIAATLAAIEATFGADRQLTVAREITKKFEAFYGGAVAQVRATLQADPNCRKGEFVIIISGAVAAPTDPQQATATMRVLLSELPLKQASKIAARLLGGNARELYALGLALKTKPAAP